MNDNEDNGRDYYYWPMCVSAENDYYWPDNSNDWQWQWLIMMCEWY